MEERTTARKIPLRILALVLAVLTLASALLLYASRVTLSGAAYAGTEYASAAQYLLSHDEYVSAPRIERMFDVLGTLGAPVSFSDYATRVSVALANENYKQAADYMLAYIKYFDGTDAAKAELYIKQGCLYSMQGEWGDAIGSFDRAEFFGSDDASYLILRAEAKLQLGKYAESLGDIQEYERYAVLGHDQKTVKALLFLKLERFDEAIRLCDELIADPGEDAITLYACRAQCYLEKGDIDAAGNDAQAYLDAGGTGDEAVIMRAVRGIQLASLGQNAEAMELLMSAIDGGYAEPAIYEQAVQCAYRMGDYERAKALCNTALAGLDDSAAYDGLAAGEGEAAFYRWIGLSCIAQKDYAGGDAAFSTVLTLADTQKYAHYFRGVCRMGAGDMPGAIDDCTASVERGEMVDESLYNRALCYIQENDAENAAADFSLVLERNENPEIIASILTLLSGEQYTAEDVTGVQTIPDDATDVK